MNGGDGHTKEKRRKRHIGRPRGITMEDAIENLDVRMCVFTLFMK